MVTLQVQEVFYSRVEAAYSPKDRSGYQVVYHSPSLGAAVVNAVESRVSCFQADGVGIRFQYFNVGEQTVLVASQELGDINSDITDRSGRPGAFVAHGLVLNSEDFAALENNPFAVFNDESNFLLTAEEMVEASTQALPRRELNVELATTPDPDTLAFEIEGWTRDMFAQIFGVAAQSASMSASKRSVSIKSEDESAVIDLLRLLFDRIPAELRLSCTFDTFAEGCQPMPGLYWAYTEYHRATNANIIQIDLERGRVEMRSGQITDQRLRNVADETFKELRVAKGLPASEKV